MKVAYVAPESAMGKAGLQPNDTIVGFLGKPLAAARPMADLWKRVQESRGDGHALVVRRGGESIELKITWR